MSIGLIGTTQSDTGALIVEMIRVRVLPFKHTHLTTAEHVPSVSTTMLRRITPFATTLLLEQNGQGVTGTSIVGTVVNWLTTVQLMAPILTAIGNTIRPLSTAGRIPARIVAKAPIPTPTIPQRLPTQITVPRSILLVPTAPPALPMLVLPQRKVIASPMEAGLIMMEPSTEEPRPVPRVITALTSMQAIL